MHQPLGFHSSPLLLLSSLLSPISPNAVPSSIISFFSSSLFPDTTSPFIEQLSISLQLHFSCCLERLLYRAETRHNANCQRHRHKGRRLTGAASRTIYTSQAHLVDPPQCSGHARPSCALSSPSATSSSGAPLPSCSSFLPIWSRTLKAEGPQSTLLHPPSSRSPS